MVECQIRGQEAVGSNSTSDGVLCPLESKIEEQVQESIQSSTIPNPGHHMGK